MVVLTMRKLGQIIDLRTRLGFRLLKFAT